MNRRLDLDYSNIPLVYLTRNDLLTIEVKSTVLELDECFDYLLVSKEDLDEKDLKAAKLAWRKGRAAGIHTAAEKMFTAMSGKSGGNVALDYLKLISANFSEEKEQKSSDGFTFNVTIP